MEAVLSFLIIVHGSGLWKGRDKEWSPDPKKEKEKENYTYLGAKKVPPRDLFINLWNLIVSAQDGEIVDAGGILLVSRHQQNDLSIKGLFLSPVNKRWLLIFSIISGARALCEPRLRLGKGKRKYARETNIQHSQKEGKNKWPTA